MVPSGAPTERHPLNWPSFMSVRLLYSHVPGTPLPGGRKHPAGPATLSTCALVQRPSTRRKGGRRPGGHESGPLHLLGRSSRLLPHLGQDRLNYLPHRMLHLFCFSDSGRWIFLLLFLLTVKLGAIAADKEEALLLSERQWEARLPRPAVWSHACHRPQSYKKQDDP